MEINREDVIELLSSFADALGNLAEFGEVYITHASRYFEGKAGYIWLETWTPTCVESNEELTREMIKLDELGEYSEATTLLFAEYEYLAWEDAKKMAAVMGGELLTVHWMEKEGISEQQSAALILLDRIKEH